MVWRESEVHPDMNELLAAKRAVPKSTDPEVLRRGWEEYAARMQRPYPPGMTVSDLSLPTPGAGRAGTVPIRLYRPAGANAVSPCIVYLHGGAFTKGNLDSGDPVAWGIADITGLVVVSADYRLAPEHPFPCGVEDCYAVLLALSKHGADYGIDGKRLAVWGDSAGGNMAAAVCLMARDRGAPLIRAQALNYACLTDDLSAPSLPALRGFAGPDGLDRPRLGPLSRVASSDRRTAMRPRSRRGPEQSAAGSCASRGVRLPRR